jgi:hypothetical protein
MLGQIRADLMKHIVGDVPDELDACLDCGNFDCTEGRFENCRNRLARAAALAALRQSEQAAAKGPLPDDTGKPG